MREVEPAVQAWREVAGEAALAAAEQLGDEVRQGRIRGPLHGIPVGIKDIIDVAGLPTRGNSRARADVAPAAVDAEVVARQIGRASCRERVCQYVSISVVAVSLKKKDSNNQFKTTLLH